MFNVIFEVLWFHCRPEPAPGNAFPGSTEPSSLKTIYNGGDRRVMPQLSLDRCYKIEQLCCATLAERYNSNNLPGVHEQDRPKIMSAAEIDYCKGKIGIVTYEDASGSHLG